MRRLFQPVLDQQVQVITLVEDLALHVRIKLHQAARFTVLLRHQLLVERRDLDVEIERRQVEVGREPLRRGAASIPLDVEGGGLVAPLDPIEVEELRELTLAVVRERDALVGK